MSIMVKADFGGTNSVGCVSSLKCYFRMWSLGGNSVIKELSPCIGSIIMNSRKRHKTIYRGITVGLGGGTSKGLCLFVHFMQMGWGVDGGVGQ